MSSTCRLAQSVNTLSLVLTAALLESLFISTCNLSPTDIHISFNSQCFVLSQSLHSCSTMENMTRQVYSQSGRGVILLRDIPYLHSSNCSRWSQGTNYAIDRGWCTITVKMKSPLFARAEILQQVAVPQDLIPSLWAGLPSLAVCDHTDDQHGEEM